jgi:NAD(P)H-dependent FMN reductase
MSIPAIGVIISSTRENRFGEKAARWIYDIARTRADLKFEIVDLLDYPLPFFEGNSPFYGQVTNEVAKRWGKKMGDLDGYLFVTAEYNRSITGVLKNALDWAYHEYNRKPAAYLGYGGVGGARAVEQLRLISVELQMAPTRSGVHIGGADFVGLLMQGKSFEEMPHLLESAGVMLDELAWWAKTLKCGRDSKAADMAA